jgi:glyoxylase-like metal-dependent hydrolase (beta-lactamase superfamily II)
MSTPPPQVHEELPGVLRIDHLWLGQPGLIASYLLGGGEDLALVEAGPASTVPALLAGIRAAGRDPEDVAHLFLTHIHLDHAAAAGVLLREHLPRARVHVHPAGAAHLADPSRLLASATRIYGERMDELWGTVLPVPAGRIAVMEDGATVRAGGFRVRALDTPGHATHHHAYHLPDAGAVFAGDVGGVRLAGALYVRPPTPPPEFDPALWRSSVERLRAAAPERLLLTHFGGYGDVARHLDELESRLDDWTRWAAREVAAGAEPAGIAERLRAREDPALHAEGGEALAGLYEAAVPYGMMATGIHRYLTRRAGSAPG